MTIFKRGNIWWYEFMFDGQRIRASTKSKSRTLANTAERKKRDEVEKSYNGVSARHRPKLFTAAAREWMSASEARWSKANLAIQRYNLKHLLAYLGSIMLADITPQHIGKYQAKRQKEDASNRTINMEVATLRMVSSPSGSGRISPQRFGCCQNARTSGGL